MCELGKLSLEFRNSRGIYKELHACGVLVRYFNKPRIEQWLRISIGTEEQLA